MHYSELTQKFRLKGEIARKGKPNERWRIIDACNTSCFIKEVNGNRIDVIDYDVLDNEWMPYRKSKVKPEEKVVIESAEDNFGNELKVGDEVYYATSFRSGKGYEIKKGTITGFSPCYVYVDGKSVSPGKIGKINP